LDTSDRKTIEIHIGGMTCDSCAEHVREALSHVDGVLRVHLCNWSSPDARVEARRDTDEHKLVAVIQRAGYSARVLSISTANDEFPVTDASTDIIDYDIAVIGTGAVGMAAVIRAAELNRRVVVIESGVVGGTCVNTGCVPSKAIIRVAEFVHDIMHPRFEGVRVQVLDVDWATIVREKDRLVATLREEKYAKVLRAYSDNVTVISGHAHFTSDKKLLIDDKHELEASKYVVATGSRPRTLDLKGADSPHVLTSTSLMDLNRLPLSLLVIGGRATALELGQVLSRLGVEVSIRQRSPRLLPEHEPEISERIRGVFEREGIRVVTNVQLRSLKANEDEAVVEAVVNDQPQRFSAERVLMAVGRSSNTDSLGLEAAGVEMDNQGFIIVDSRMQTTNPRIFAAGDVVSGLLKLVYVAASTGQIATESALDS